MAQYGGSESQIAFPSLNETVAILVPKVEDLLRRVCHGEPVAVSTGESAVDIEAPIGFPDGIGNGTVLAELFRYREAIRLDIQIKHNRVFATRSGAPTDRKCFFNDYVASVTVSNDATEIPQDFVRKVVSGIMAARDAVKRHNRQARGVWDEVSVAAQD